MDANSVIRNCIIINNDGRYFGGAVFYGQEDVNGKSTPLLDSCILMGNKVDQGGGAVYAVHAIPVIRNSILASNTADYAGAVFGSHANITMERCLMYGNTVSKSTVVIGCVDPEIDKRARIAVKHCTIAGNTTTIDSLLGRYAISLDKRCVGDTVVNSIVWNTGSRFVSDSTDIVASHSAIRGGFTGDTIISADPLLNTDYSLKPGSPCIDKATDGTDIGALESALLGDMQAIAKGLGIIPKAMSRSRQLPQSCSGQNLYPSFFR